MNENPFEDQGSIGVHIEKTEFTIAPTGYTTITVNLRNQRLENDSQTTQILTDGGGNETR